MVVTRKNDEAVSPVIGVILMVAITVILAAVIAAFVFGMSGNISKTKTVAVTAQKLDTTHISIMNQGGQDQASVVSLNVTTQPNPAVNCQIGSGTATAAASGVCTLNPAAVGSTITVISGAAPASYSGRTEVVVVGSFSDSTTQVLLDTFL
jgi:archaeal type IV pilus assembly protein PilA